MVKSVFQEKKKLLEDPYQLNKFDISPKLSVEISDDINNRDWIVHREMCQFVEDLSKSMN